ncbi:amino acid adenylation domain-containing protein [Kitasatospora sp. NPDC052896]|uniref:amino acid adenylation domain-containing protein n=1 Tax=Kitasatospora sp. NPDC052896 TaxID=3364061 RepID=UPI0037C7DDCD
MTQTQNLVSRLSRLTPAERQALLQRVRQRRAGGIPPIPRDEPIPASYAQERMWFLWQLAPDSATYHVPWAYRIDGPLDLARLGNALDALIERHEILRTTLREVDGEIRQIIHPARPTHLTATPAHPEEALRLAHQAAEQPFDLTTGPLLRIHLWRTGDDRHLILFAAHHVILDEWSLAILERELWTLYRGEQLPPLDVQYADFSVWQREHLATGDDLAHWQRELADAIPAAPHPDRTPPEHSAFVGDRRTATVPDDRLGWLTELQQKVGTTDFTVLFALHCLFLARHSGTTDVTVGTPVSGRTHADLAGQLGFFVNTLAVRVRLDPTEDFPTYLRRVRGIVLDAFAHQELPFEQVVRAVAPARAAARNPLFSTMFSYAPAQVSAELLAGLPAGLSVEHVQLPFSGSHFDLSLAANRTTDGLLLTLDFSTERYEGATADQLLRSLTDLFAALAADPGASMGTLLRPSPRELTQLQAWNDTVTARPDAPVHELLRAQARRTPDAVAIEADDTTLTFAELDTASDHLAHHLHHHGIRCGDLIGIQLRPGARALIAVWGVWKAGAAFLPLDPDLPTARLHTMIEDARPALLLTEDTTLEDAPTTDLPQVGARDLAYVMYTSGSTGRPKGVMVDHGNLTNFATAQLIPRLRGAETGQHLRVAIGTSAFISDFFIAQLLTLLDGHTLTVLTPEERSDPRMLLARAQHPNRAVEALDCTTSQLHLLVDAGLLDAPHPPRILTFGGEACPPDLWTTLRAAHPRAVALNTYGPTEATVEATVTDVMTSPTPVIGKPYGNTRIHLLDPQGKPVVPGTLGEIHISGPGVGPGYLNRPDLTADAFVPDPWGPPGARLYRTGDLGRQRADGQLEFHGRNDHQIKILGQRIEPEEVEAALRTHPRVASAAVSATGTQLAAHLVLTDGPTPDPQEIRAHLTGLLPKAAVPTLLVFVDALPLTTNGKLDRKALHVPEHTAPTTTEPRTDTERRVAEIWHELLGRDTIGIHDDFFALGGHSLLASRLVLRLGTDFPLHQAFNSPTIAEQAAWLDTHATTTSGIPPIPRDEPIPASYAQERMWFLWQLAPDSATYHVPWAYRIDGPLDLARLGNALDALTERHEILRTTLREVDGEIRQIIHPARPTHLTATPAHPEEALRLAHQAAEEPFDLTTGPLLRVHAWQTGDNRHLILFAAHHAILDEWSLTILESELWTLYQGEQLPPLNVQYADFSTWQRQQPTDLAHWQQELADCTPTAPLPDHTPPEHPSFAGDRRTTTIPIRLDDLRQDVGTTDFTILFALYCLFLARHTGETDITVGTPVSGRTHPDTADQLGLFVNTLALRIHINPTEDFPNYLTRVRTTLLEAFAHQDTPFDQVVRAVAPARAAARNPLFSTMFSHGRQSESASPGELGIAGVELGSGGSHFDLSLGIAETAEGLVLALDFSTELYEGTTIDGYLASLTDLFAALAADPGASIGTLLRPSPRELTQLQAWNDTVTAQPDAPVHELLRAQARRTPDAIAIEADDTTLTFAELDTASDHLAHHLHHHGIQCGDLVGIQLRPGARALIAVWGVWKAGAAFLPLDPDLPTARLHTMIEDARPALLLTEDTTLEDAPTTDLPQVGARDLAYVMYTSGSTGRPKGVMVDHGNLTNFATAQLIPRLRGAETGQHLRVAIGTSAFISDFFIAQLLTLLDGHTLTVLTPEERSDPRMLLARAQHPDRAIQALDCTTSQLHLLVDAGLLDAPHPPRILTFGGEACPPDLWTTLRGHRRTVAFNAYGPTEATVEATVTDVMTSPTPVIGKPYGNTRIHLLDPQGKPVVPGTLGEIHIGGPGVGPGYLNRPDLTADAFVPDPWGPPGARLYRTGDLARHRTNGHLEFHGRNDHQIKILGQRIEPEEVEAALRTHPRVIAAAVSSTGTHLAAHLVLTDGPAPDPQEIRTHLTGLLPKAAIPTQLVHLDALPLTTNGKLDRKALRIPEHTAPTTTEPRTDTERRVAEIWHELLGHDTIDIHDDFFALGGHSLLASRLVLRLGTDFPLHQAFNSPTIAEQAAWLDTHATTTSGIPRTARDQPIPASYAQERMWFLWQLAPDSPTYHVPWAYRIDGPLDLTRLSNALDALTERHEILRTTLREAEGQIQQVIHPAPTTNLTAAIATPDQALQLARQAAEEPFDLTTGPLLRVHAWQTGDNRHLILFAAHHVILDEWSLTILESELWTLYQGEQLPPLNVQYADFSTWQRQQPTDLAHWQHTLTGSTPTAPHPDRTPPEHPTFAGDRRTTTIGAQQLSWLDDLRQDVGTTDFTILFALYCLFLARHTGETDITVGTPVSGRTHPDTADQLGLFVNTLALRIHINPTEDFPNYLTRVRTTLLEAFAHQHSPFDHVVRAIAPARATTRNPLFSTGFLYTHENATPQHPLPVGLTLQSVELATGGSHFDLLLGTSRTPDGLVLALDFSTDHYDGETADRFLTSLTDLFASLTADPAAPIATLLRPSPRELTRLQRWNDTTTRHPDTPVHDLLRAQARRTPDAIAIEADGIELTFAELDAASERMAHRLSHRGVRHGDLVGINLRPGARALIAVWAVWKAGAAFLPLDPDLPTARLDTMIQDARPALLLTEDTTLEDAPTTDLPQVSARDLAYVMYTSGSTGRPKGVMVDHGNLTNHATSQLIPRLRSAVAERKLRVVTGTSAFISDFFIAQFLTLLDGHTLTVLTPDERRDPRHLVERAHDSDRAIGMVEATTSQVQLLADEGLLDAPHPPRVLIVAGEACPPDLWTTLRAAHPRTISFNAYGPTEATVEATCADLTASPTPVIGKPFGNVRIHLLDAHGEPVVPGTIGEIHIGGPGVGPGYLNRPDLTADAFVPDPWGPPGARLYRTGDLARHRTNGHLEFHGRNDHQIKILGQRIEPEEVEAALRTHPRVIAAAITQRPGTTQLVAHLVLTDGPAPDPQEIRTHLTGLLPKAAIPTQLVHLDALPLTTNGKLDRKALHIPEHTAPTTTEPRTDTERRVAEIWHELLGHDTIDIHDDFFALGGHSLLAVRLATALRTKLGTGLPLARLLAVPTVAGQAALLDASDQQPPAGRTLIPLGGRPGLQPLVLVHPLGGTVHCYQQLADELGSSFEILGVQGDLLGGSAIPGLASLATRYAQDLAPLLTGRRPVLAGWSAGGLLAHELAAQLGALGVTIDRLVILDADPHTGEQAPESAEQLTAEAAALELLRTEVERHGPGRLLQAPSAERLFAVLGTDPGALADLDGRTVATLMAFWRDLLVGLAEHRPARFAGRAELVLALAEGPHSRDGFADSWRELADEMTVTTIDTADHYQLLRHPSVRTVAEILRTPTPTPQTGA